MTTRSLLDPAGRMVPTLVQHQARRFLLAVGFKGDLRINYLQEEVVVALWKHFHLLLSGRLCKQVISLASYGQNEIGREFIGSYVIVQNPGVDCHLKGVTSGSATTRPRHCRQSRCRCLAANVSIAQRPEVERVSSPPGRISEMLDWKPADLLMTKLRDTI